jgi:hypothetical protein
MPGPRPIWTAIESARADAAVIGPCPTKVRPCGSTLVQPGTLPSGVFLTLRPRLGAYLLTAREVSPELRLGQADSRSEQDERG